jgi:hypothetical protein
MRRETKKVEGKWIKEGQKVDVWIEFPAKKFTEDSLEQYTRVLTHIRSVYPSLRHLVILK